MADSDRPSETKAQIKARHQAELEAMGYVPWIKKWGGVAGAITAIIALCITIGTQVWPWMVQYGVKKELTTARKTAESVEDLKKLVEQTQALLQATIKATDEQVQESDLRAQRMHDSIEALRNEVRLRHGIESGIVLTAIQPVHTSGITVGSAGGGSAGSSSRPRPRRARPMTRQQKLKAVTEQADATLKAAEIDPTADFDDDVKAKLKIQKKK